MRGRFTRRAWANVPLGCTHIYRAESVGFGKVHEESAGIFPVPSSPIPRVVFFHVYHSRSLSYSYLVWPLRILFTHHSLPLRSSRAHTHSVSLSLKLSPSLKLSLARSFPLFSLSNAVSLFLFLCQAARLRTNCLARSTRSRFTPTSWESPASKSAPPPSPMTPLPLFFILPFCPWP